MNIFTSVISPYLASFDFILQCFVKESVVWAFSFLVLLAAGVWLESVSLKHVTVQYDLCQSVNLLII